jgi:hypothetical protein
MDYFWEWFNMSGVNQAVFMNQRSFGPPDIGAAFGGGFYAGQISTSGNGVATHNLVVAPKSSGENSSRQWKTTSTDTAGTSSVINGPTNSANMNNAAHPAAQFCEGLTIGGFSDWYLPARNELEVCYYNLKPDTTSNNSSWGTNTNAVPSRGSNYTAGSPASNPAQTSAANFQTGGAEAFTSGPFYWSSTEANTTRSWVITFATGQQYGLIKTYAQPVRAIRRVAV